LNRKRTVTIEAAAASTGKEVIWRKADTRRAKAMIEAGDRIAPSLAMCGTSRAEAIWAEAGRITEGTGSRRPVFIARMYRRIPAVMNPEAFQDAFARIRKRADAAAAGMLRRDPGALTDFSTAQQRNRMNGTATVSR